jgi:hypothetical protein
MAETRERCKMKSSQRNEMNFQYQGEGGRRGEMNESRRDKWMGEL